MNPETEAFLKRAGFTLIGADNLRRVSTYTARLRAGLCSIEVTHKDTPAEVCSLILAAGAQAARERIAGRWNSFQDSLNRP